MIFLIYEFSVYKNTYHYTFVTNVDSLDYTGLTVDEIVSRVVSRARNGSIILFHNGVDTTAEALDKVLTELEKQEYSFVSINDLIYKENYSIDHTGRQIKTNKDLPG